MAPTVVVPNQGGMFHTFQGVAPRKSAGDSSQGRSTGSSGSKRVTISHACAECKRRKIRCDGQQPCGQCLSSRAPKQCFYDRHRQRVIPSRKTLETLSQQLEECRSILKRLYPNQDLASLAPLSRQELLSRLEQPSTPEPLPSPPLNNSAVKHETGASQIPDFAPEFFDQTASSLGSERGHGSHFKVPLHDDIDDMNTQKTALDRDLESLGPTSIKAALMVMLKVRPQVKSSLVPNLHNIEITSNIPLIRQRPMVSKESPRPIWSWKDQTSLEAYFKRIHPLIPMLDENSFRSDYLQGRRNDSPWLSLLNMMLALGSIASTKSNDLSHTNFYNRAMEHITIESFASSSIETVQALAMIGGVYLHYINRSHMANAVMGAAIRMASSLGLHRDLPYQSGEDATTTESRRRTWWSLFCLDTWATTSMGRPSFGRFGPAMMMPRPEFNTTQDSGRLASILPLTENIKLCRIATRIQDLMATGPVVRGEERCSIDGQLVSWYTNLPWLLRTMEPCAESLYMARCMLKWRYQSLRLLLHRPILLAVASHSTTSDAKPSDQDLASVEKCRDMAEATISDISREWTQNQMAAWTAVLYLYQAVMIPLVSIFWERHSPQVPRWQRQVEVVLDLLAAMDEWSLAASRSREVVWRMYEASHHALTLGGPEQSTTGQHGIILGDADVGLSPTGLEAGDMVGLFEDSIFLGVDGVPYWGQGQGSLPTADTMCDIGGQGIMPMGYATTGHPEPSIGPPFFVQ